MNTSTSHSWRSLPSSVGFKDSVCAFTSVALDHEPARIHWQRLLSLLSNALARLQALIIERVIPDLSARRQMADAFVRYLGNLELCHVNAICRIESSRIARSCSLLRLPMHSRRSIAISSGVPSPAEIGRSAK